MGHEELKEIGINAYGHRHKLIKGVERLLGGQQGEGGQHHTHPECWRGMVSGDQSGSSQCILSVNKVRHTVSSEQLTGTAVVTI